MHIEWVVEGVCKLMGFNSSAVSVKQFDRAMTIPSNSAPFVFVYVAFDVANYFASRGSMSHDG
jgi:hypothetical protein